MREFTPEEKELIVNTPIRRMECFEDMKNLNNFYLADSHKSVKDIWLNLIGILENLRLSYLRTKDENYFIELVRLLPNSYKVVKLC